MGERPLEPRSCRELWIDVDGIVIPADRRKRVELLLRELELSSDSKTRRKIHDYGPTGVSKRMNFTLTTACGFHTSF